MNEKVIENKAKLEISAGELLYWGFWGVMLFAKGIGLYEGMKLYNFCLIGAFLCVIAKILFTKHSGKDYVWMGLLALLSGIVYIHSGDKSALIYTMMIIGLKNVPLRRLFKIGAVIWGTCFLFMTVLGVFGVVTGPILVHERFGLGPVIRWSLGYTHPNVLHISYTVLVAFILYSVRLDGKRLFFWITGLFLGNCYILLYSGSNTGFLLTCIYLFFFVYFHMRNKLNKLERAGIYCVLPFCILFSIVGPILLRPFPIFDVINKITNTRYLASRIYLTGTGITLFGSRVDEKISLGFALDCSYVEAFVYYGIILFTVFMLGYFLIIRQFAKQNKTKELALVLSFLIAGVSEPFLFNTSFKNLPLLFVGSYFFQLADSWKSASVLEREFCLVSWNSSISFDRESWKKIGGIINTAWKKKGKIITIGILAGVCASALFVTTQRPKDSVYIPVENTDVPEQETVYLDIEKLPENFNGIVLNYRGPDVEMYKFTGNIVILEYVRKGLSVFIWSSVAAGGVIYLWNFGCQIRKLKEKGKT